MQSLSARPLAHTHSRTPPTHVRRTVVPFLVLLSYALTFSRPPSPCSRWPSPSIWFPRQVNCSRVRPSGAPARGDVGGPCSQCMDRRIRSLGSGGPGKSRPPHILRIPCISELVAKLKKTQPRHPSPLPLPLPRPLLPHHHCLTTDPKGKACHQRSYGCRSRGKQR